MQLSFPFMTRHHALVGFSHNPPRHEACAKANYPLWSLFLRVLNSPAEMSLREWTEYDVVQWAHAKISEMNMRGGNV